MSDIHQVLEERGSRYGSFETHALITQTLKKVLREGYESTHPGKSYYDLAPDILEELDMIAHKLGRVVNGDPEYIDSHTDISGYATLVADRLEHDLQS